MSLKSLSLVLFFFLFFLSISVDGFGDGPQLGPYWSPITNTKDSYFVQIAKSAVKQYNREKKGNIAFTGIVRGEAQIIDEFANYRLVISAIKKSSGGGDGPASMASEDPYYSVLIFKRGDILRIICFDELK